MGAEKSRRKRRGNLVPAEQREHYRRRRSALRLSIKELAGATGLSLSVIKTALSGGESEVYLDPETVSTLEGALGLAAVAHSAPGFLKLVDATREADSQLIPLVRNWNLP